ncbi:acyl-CoA dehydrogenase [Sulfoacidibacillus thermotolerans]|uniref:Acyl-CoA dehydrogenase n=1 Tax=Sulfoacidibacillus thermotolerans TaxID=1765684 RepID=A0A2U3D9K2_SULT2|nr:acyl-CoA dehydrogenase [Sulfoacidibacillus thermotolerans]PWI57951.1 acyl-CoA dehydrogenase [Sulfoacidibacillus thermotolerans]
MNFTLTEEQEALRKLVRDFAMKEVAPSAAQRDEEEVFDRAIFNKMGRIGLTGIPWPEEYGGAGLDFVSYVIAVEELSRVCASTGVTLSAHLSLASWPIFKFGTEEQKQKYLRPLALGEKLGAYGLTEPSAGTDAASLRTTAVRDGDEYILNGTKMFTTNGGEADIYVVFATTDASKKAKGVTAFIVEKGMPGFTFGKKEKKMGIRSSPTVELIFDQCRVPMANVLGEEGQGFKIAMMTLDGGRNGIAAQALGIASGALDAALEYAKTRTQFNRPITDFQAIQFKLADMAKQVEAARLLTYQAAWLEDNQLPYGKASAMAKVFASDAAMYVTTEAVQIHGGYGFTRDYAVERFMRDAKITQIYEGTNEVQRIVIAGHVLKD